MNEFLQMGGYGFYVWTTYGLAMAILMINLISPILRRRRIFTTLARRLRHERNES